MEFSAVLNRQTTDQFLNGAGSEEGLSKIRIFLTKTVPQLLAKMQLEAHEGTPDVLLEHLSKLEIEALDYGAESLSGLCRDLAAQVQSGVIPFDEIQIERITAAYMAVQEEFLHHYL